MTQQVSAVCYTLRTLLANAKRPILIGIAGDSGSGKTTYSKGIRRLFGDDLVTTITMDDYHAEDRAQRKSSGRLPLDPGANHFALLAEHLQQLRRGETIQKPVYNHSTGCFDPTEPLAPTPIVVIEGLHALYPEFLPFFDFTLYVDPSREVKWHWKYQRDVHQRGHDAEALKAEMLKREAAYKRWIDFQKTEADMVIKIEPSQLAEMALHDYDGEAPDCLKYLLVMTDSERPLPPPAVRFDIGNLFGANRNPFSIGAVPCLFWGKPGTTIHLDGMLPPSMVQETEQQLMNYTGVPIGDALPLIDHERVPVNHFVQLLVAWRFIERLTGLLQESLPREEAIYV